MKLKIDFQLRWRNSAAPLGSFPEVFPPLPYWMVCSRVTEWICRTVRVIGTREGFPVQAGRRGDALGLPSDFRAGKDWRRFDLERKDTGPLVPEEVSRRGAERAVSGSSVRLCARDREEEMVKKTHLRNTTVWNKRTGLTLWTGFL